MKPTEMQNMKPIMDDHMKREYRKWWYELSKDDIKKREQDKRTKRKPMEKFDNLKKFRSLRARIHSIKMEIKDIPLLKETCGERIRDPEFDEEYYRAIAKNIGYHNKKRADWLNKEIDEIVDGIAILTGKGKVKHGKGRKRVDIS
jgi:hypothetical protein